MLISSGKVFKSKKNEQVPHVGAVAGRQSRPFDTTNFHDTRTRSAGITASRAIELLESQMAEPVEELPYDDPGVYEWETITHRILADAFGPNHRNTNHFAATVTYSGLSAEEYQAHHVQWARDKKGMLKAFIKELQMF